MLKHAACAAAISSSGFVPRAFSNRVAYVNGVSRKTPLVALIAPLPPLRSPRQTADAVRSIAATPSLLLLYAVCRACSRRREKETPRRLRGGVLVHCPAF